MTGITIASGRGGPSFIMSRKTFSVAVLFVFVISPAFVSSEVISLLMFVWIAGAIISSGFRLHRGVLPLVAPLLLFIIIGLLCAYNNTILNIFKDFWYAGKAVLALMVGYMLMIRINDFKTMLRIFICAAVVCSLYHLAYFIVHPELLYESVMSLREVAGKGYFINVLAVAVILACYRWKIDIFPKMRWLAFLALTVCLLSLAMAFSRTLWLSLSAMSIVLMGFLNVKNVKKLVVVGVAALVVLIFILATPEAEQIGADATLRGKLAYSIKEMKVRNYVNIKDINHHWRGYESFMAQKYYLEGNTAQYFVGRGFGSLVDIGLYMKLGGEEYLRYIPILHNGYFYILVKTGMAGILVYMSLFASLILYGKSFENSTYEDAKLAGLLLVSLSIAFLLTTMVVTGLFNRILMTPATVMTGSVYAYLNCRNRNIDSAVS